MILKDYHIHSSYCDGRNSPEEIVIAAIEKGMQEIGIVTHSYTSFDTRYCIEKQRQQEFQNEIRRLRDKYSDRLSILCGLEQDIFSDATAEGFDYIIGAVHYIRCGDEYRCVDETEELLLDTAKEYFSGDIYALAETYYDLVAQIPKYCSAQIIAHIDLISKFNEGGRLFSETDSRYIGSYQRAIDALIPYGIPFEINTGAISRGYRVTPYPSMAIRDYIVSCGGSLLLSSDSHSATTVAHEFEKWEHLIYCNK